MSLEHAQSLVDFLATELKNRSARNPRYSLRAFAHSLKLSPGELSEILRGKRQPTLKGAMKIARALGLGPQETQKLLALSGNLGPVPGSWSASGMAGGPHVAGTSDGMDSATALQSWQLTMDLFHVVSDWYCFAILNLADTANFSAHPKRIARRLGITEMESKIAIDRLERVGLIERVEPTREKKSRNSPHGGQARGSDDSRAPAGARVPTFRATPDYVLSPQGIPSEAVRSYHRQILEKASIALDEQSVDEREVAGITFAVDPETLPHFKKELHRLLDRLAADAAKQSPGRRTEVYHLETALFRLSKPEDKR